MPSAASSSAIPANAASSVVRKRASAIEPSTTSSSVASCVSARSLSTPATCALRLRQRRVRSDRRADDEGQRVLHPLTEVRVLGRLRRPIQAVLLLVGDDADDRDPWSVVLRPSERDPLADDRRVGQTVEVSARQRLVDDRDRRLLARVAVVEQPAGEQADAHRAEVARRRRHVARVALVVGG